MNHFDTIAEQWDQDPRRLVRARAVADAILEHVPGLEGKKGFEYGCGTGLLSFCLHPHLSSITLADNSEGMLSVLQQKIAASGLTHMHPVKLDLTTDPRPLYAYDLVYTLLTLHHIADTAHILQAFYDILTPGGTLCLIDLVQEDGSFHDEEFHGHNGFDTEALEQQLEEAGFHHVSCRICYEVVKKKGDGVERRYPLFLITGSK